MKKFLSLLKYVFQKQKQLLKYALLYLLLFVLFSVTTLVLYVVLIANACGEISALYFWGLTLLHLIIIPILYFRVSYRIVLSTVLRQIYKDRKPEMENKVTEMIEDVVKKEEKPNKKDWLKDTFSWLSKLPCLLYTSDAADEFL